ncbi:hypothetical protein K492DRAFT_199184 [Lichtheimia hyalospora FSU 10163]|nr:hypothetical protein K492DRAFT_199184 [Lichtheimia hyalospora FSU 10163]
MIKSWQFRNNTVQPSSPSTTPSTFKHLIPSISILNFPISATTNNNNNNKTNDSIEDDSQSSSPPPPLFDCNDDDHVNDAHPECPRAIRPVQILTERLEGWQLLVKQLYDYFGQLATTESQVAKAYERMNNFGHYQNDDNNDRSTFLGSHLTCMHGIRHICMAWETHHVDTAKGHAMLSNYLEMHVIPTLATMKRELKSMIRSVHTDDRLRLSTLAKMRREAKRRLQRLEKQLLFFEQYPQHGHAKQDPWLHVAVVQHMLKVYHQTNKMHETILRLQKEVMITEQQFIQDFRQLCQDIYNVREQTALGIDPGYEKMIQAVESVATDDDWNDFCQHHKHDLISENARFLHPDQLEYPNHTHPLVQPIFAARMERNSNFLHRWHEYIYVLTPAGFLHEYKSSRSYPNKPDASIFVPHYNVSTLSTNLHHNLIFQLQAQERHHLQEYMPPTSSSASTASSSLSFTSVLSEPRGRNRSMNSKTLTFRAKSASDMQAWLEHLTELSYRYRPSVSYSAPPFSQPNNATNPEVLITSPTMTVVDKQQGLHPSSSSSSSSHRDTNTVSIPEKESQQDPMPTSIIAPMIVPQDTSNAATASILPSNDDNKSSSSLVDQQQATKEHASPIISSPLSGCRSESNSSKDRPFILMGVCLPEDMQS